mgnify:FL=1
MKVDIHAHFFPDIGREEAISFGFDQPPWLRINNEKSGMMMDGDREYRPVQSPLWNSSDRLEEMNRNEIDIQIMSPTPMLFAYA